MAVTNLKFHRTSGTPVNPTEGSIWFNPAKKRIQLYKNSAWEDYSGEVLDATLSNNVLTITKREGTVTLDLTSLYSRVSTLETGYEDVEDAIEGINGQLKTIDQNYQTLSGNLTTVSNSIGTKITTEINKLDATVHSVGSGKTFATTDMSGHVAVQVVEANGKLTSVSVLEKDIASAGALNTLSGTVSDLGDAIDVLNGTDSGKSVRKIANEELAAVLITGADNGAVDNFKTLKELADWLEQHPEDAAEMNSEIAALKTAVGSLQTGTVSSFGGKTGAITIRGGQKGNGSVNLAMSGNQLQASIVGLGSAAYTASTAYASAAQGTKADSALQSSDIATGSSNGTISVKGTNVAVKGLGSAAYTKSDAYATSAQGTLAASAIQKVTSGNTTYLTVGTKSQDNNDSKKYYQSITPVIGAYGGTNGLATTSATTTYVESVFAWAEY